MSTSRNRIFGGKGSIREYLSPIVKKIDSEIESTSENYILTVSEEQYSEYLLDKYSIEIPEIHFPEVYADSYEKQISAEDHPTGFGFFREDKYNRTVVQFFVPVSGNSEVLRYFPGISTITIGGPITNFEVENSSLKLEVIDFYNDPTKVKQIFDENVNNSHKKFNDLLSDLKLFNNSLGSHIKEKIRDRKSKFLQKNEFMSSLGVPLKKKSDAAKTFSVPRPNLRNKISILKPSVSNETFRPEPILDEKTYNQILKLVNDIGKNFERLPSIYKDKGEEDLRDHIIMTLDPNFEYGTVTGETFNKTGKTDIQLRYDSSVIFIAECKFWTGEKGYLKTISQLLNYLTWRDTKASVIIFARQKDFSSILNKVKEVTSSHENYLAFVSANDENWFNYRFYLNGDKNREVKLAIQLFHLP